MCYLVVSLSSRNFWRIKKITIKGNTTELDQNNSFLGRNVDDLIFLINNSKIKYIVFDNMQIDQDFGNSLKTLNSLKEMVFLINKNKKQITKEWWIKKFFKFKKLKDNSEIKFIYCIEESENINKLNKIFDYQIRLNSGLGDNMVDKMVDDIQRNISTISGTNIIKSGFPDYRYIQKDLLRKVLNKYFPYIQDWKTLKNIQYAILNFDLISKNKSILNLSKEIEEKLPEFKEKDFYKKFKYMFYQIGQNIKEIDNTQWKELKNQNLECSENNCEFCISKFSKYHLVLTFQDDQKVKKHLVVENKSCEDQFKNAFSFSYISDYLLFKLHEHNFIDNNYQKEILQKSQIRFTSLINFLGLTLYKNLINVQPSKQDTQSNEFYKKRNLKKWNDNKIQLLSSEDICYSINNQISKEIVEYLYKKVKKITKNNLVVTDYEKRYCDLILFLTQKNIEISENKLNKVKVIVKEIRNEISSSYQRRHSNSHLLSILLIQPNSSETENNKIFKDLENDGFINNRIIENIDPSELIFDNKKLLKCHLIEHVNLKQSKNSLDDSCFINSNLHCYIINKQKLESLIDELLQIVNKDQRENKDFQSILKFIDDYESINKFREIEFGIIEIERLMTKNLKTLLFKNN